MAKKNELSEATPARPPTLKKQNSSAGSKNGSILSFFSKASANGTSNSPAGTWMANGEPKGVNAIPKPSLPVKKPAFKKAAVRSMTPVASSDAIGPSSSQENENNGIPEEVEDNGLPSPATPAKNLQAVNGSGMAFGSSPSRKVRRTSYFFQIRNPELIGFFLQAKKAISYAESSDDEDAFDPAGISTRKKAMRAKRVVEDDDDEEDTFIGGLDGAADDDGKHTQYLSKSYFNSLQMKWTTSS